GGQIGYNQQVGNVVFGIEADASWAGVDGHRSIDIGGPLLGGTQTLRAGTTIDGLATLTGRLGLAQDRWLVYVKGGAAWVREKHDISRTSTFGSFTQTLSASGTEDRVGYTFGIGSEWALSGNWSLKSEYNYV